MVENAILAIERLSSADPIENTQANEFLMSLLEFPSTISLFSEISASDSLPVITRLYSLVILRRYFLKYTLQDLNSVENNLSQQILFSLQNSLEKSDLFMLSKAICDVLIVVAPDIFRFELLPGLYPYSLKLFESPSKILTAFYFFKGIFSSLSYEQQNTCAPIICQSYVNYSNSQDSQIRLEALRNLSELTFNLNTFDAVTPFFNREIINFLNAVTSNQRQFNEAIEFCSYIKDSILQQIPFVIKDIQEIQNTMKSLMDPDVPSSVKFALFDILYALLLVYMDPVEECDSILHLCFQFVSECIDDEASTQYASAVNTILSVLSNANRNQAFLAVYLDNLRSLVDRFGHDGTAVYFSLLETILPEFHPLMEEVCDLIVNLASLLTPDNEQGIAEFASFLTTSSVFPMFSSLLLPMLLPFIGYSFDMSVAQGFKAMTLSCQTPLKNHPECVDTLVGLLSDPLCNSHDEIILLITSLLRKGVLPEEVGNDLINPIISYFMEHSATLPSVLVMMSLNPSIYTDIVLSWIDNRFSEDELKQLAYYLSLFTLYSLEYSKEVSKLSALASRIYKYLSIGESDEVTVEGFMGCIEKEACSGLCLIRCFDSETLEEEGKRVLNQICEENSEKTLRRRKCMAVTGYALRECMAIWQNESYSESFIREIGEVELDSSLPLLLKTVVPIIRADINRFSTVLHTMLSLIEYIRGVSVNSEDYQEMIGICENVYQTLGEVISEFYTHISKETLQEFKEVLMGTMSEASGDVLFFSWRVLKSLDDIEGSGQLNNFLKQMGELISESISIPCQIVLEGILNKL